MTSDFRLLTFDSHTVPVPAQHSRIIGTGAMKPSGADTGEIVRMSVAHDCRRRSIGRRILNALIEGARDRGYARIILETTETWAGAIAFYRSAGFEITHYQDGDVYFVLELGGAAFSPDAVRYTAGKTSRRDVSTKPPSGNAP